MLTPKREAFAQAVASGKNQSDAYRMAYRVRESTKPETINQAASRLMAKGNIAARVAELREPIVEKVRMTLEGHLEDLMRLRNMAAKGKQFGAAITAEIARGRASGVTAEASTGSVAASTAEQLREIAKRLPV